MTRKVTIHRELRAAKESRPKRSSDNGFVPGSWQEAAYFLVLAVAAAAAVAMVMCVVWTIASSR